MVSDIFIDTFVAWSKYVMFYKSYNELQEYINFIYICHLCAEYLRKVIKHTYINRYLGKYV